MCALSYVSPQIDGPEPWAPYKEWDLPNKIVPSTPAIDRVTSYKVNGPFVSWSYKQCFAYVELVEKAQEFDKINDEPTCSDPEKTKHLGDLRQRITSIGLEQPFQSRECLELATRLDTIIENL